MQIEWSKIYRLISGVADKNERKEVSEWASQEKARKRFLKDAEEFYRTESEQDITFDQIRDAWSKVNPQRRRRNRYFKYSIPAVAASLFVIFSTLLYNNYLSAVKIPAIEHGEERANLILADGRNIPLGSNIKKISQELPVVQKMEGKKTTLTIDVKNRMSENLYDLNEITVPRYAEYQINLEDGTKVWLNSETKLKFPLAFGEKERVVYVSGEAFFQVAHNAGRPFIVKIDEDTKVKVLGTEFNIRTYEENMSQSTLISGSIEFIYKDSITKISPGEICCLNKISGTLMVEKADTMRTIAWKNGEFIFRNETLECIVKELSRWYKVEVSFENNEIKNERFYLYFNRTTGFEEIMGMLYKTGKIKYQYKNKKIVIS